MGRTPKSVVEIYEDFQRRRQALLNALTDGENLAIFVFFLV